jgi:hypothetical protein
MPYIEINGEEWMQCGACGNIWDGFAQCQCANEDDDEYMIIEIDYDAESGYESN